ncbi:MAG: SDR family oxidoreductase [Parachlamydiaceae bacterium]|nr:SDR family oxidoreductase [Parachlamydiaceae bacterium]
MEKKYDTNNRHIIISGGSKGLGLAICQDLLNLGYHVSSFSRAKTEEIDHLLAQYPNTFYYDTLDICNHEALDKFIQKAVVKHPNLFGLINNAAVVQEGVLATLPEIEIDKMVSVNLTSALNLSRLFLRKILNSTSGRIINISSIVGSRGYSGLSVYSATKAALDGMTRSLARELGSRNITINSIAPGYMETDLSATLSEEQLKKIVNRTPLGRLAMIGDILPSVRFLLSNDSSFITGQTILIDGGISI